MNEDTNSNTTSTEPSDIKSQVLAFRDNAHAANVKKLKAGIKCIFTVPACFLILLFLTGSSKIIFLVLWIASLFIIAAYLKVQEMVNSLQDTEDNIDGLIDINSIYTKVAAPKKKLDDIITNVKTDIQTQITAVQDKVAEMAEAVQNDQSVSVQSDEQNETVQTDEHGDSVQTDEHGDSVQTDEQDEATENTEADKEELS